MRVATMIHGIKKITEFKYHPNNNHGIGFTLQEADCLDHQEVTIWGLSPEDAEDFYLRNTGPDFLNLQKEVKRLKEVLQTIANTPNPQDLARSELIHSEYPSNLY